MLEAMLHRVNPVRRVLFVVFAMVLSPLPAASAEQLLPDLWLKNPFAACNKDCLFGVYAGQLVNTGMFEIFVSKHIMPWAWHYKDAYLVSGTFDRPVLLYGRHFEVDTEGGAGKRLGLLSEGELWGALYFRYKQFPWDNYVRTSVAVSTGLDYATDVPPFEVQRSNGRGDRLLHYLSPEITLGLPQYPDVDFVARFHHRSGGALPVFSRTGGGAQFGELGLRFRL